MDIIWRTSTGRWVTTQLKIETKETHGVKRSKGDTVEVQIIRRKDDTNVSTISSGKNRVSH